jgi:anthranilate synthase component 1
MEVAPEQQAFAARYSAGVPQLVSTTLVADLETPVSAFLKLAGGKGNAFLFESVEGGAVRGPSIIGRSPIWSGAPTAAGRINHSALTRPMRRPCPDLP